MNALGHTMASMSQRGGKPSANTVDTAPGRRGNGRSKGGNQRGSDASSNTISNGAGRGQNINHLLAFTLPPRISNSSAHSGARKSRRGGGGYVPFNKERYVNAQYRFLVKPTGDYTAYFADSDIFLNWSDILTVLIPTTSALSAASHTYSAASASSPSLSAQPSLETHEGATCPICLSQPTAPRMTKCGHVYCYPCILHYLTVNDAPVASGSSTPNFNGTFSHHIPGSTPRLSSGITHTATHPGLSSHVPPKWKRCPVCWDAVYARDLKAVQWWDPKARAQDFQSESEQDFSSTASKTGHDDNLCMRLIERPHLTTLALPRSSTWPTASTSTSDQPLIAQHSAPWHFQPDVMTFSKFMLATPDLLLQNLNTDMIELSSERELLRSFLTKDEIGVMFVEMAERKVQEQMEKVTNELDTQSVRSRIGYARKELEEHYELERGNRARDEEAMSRRQRKRLERQKNEVNDDDDDDDEGKADAIQQDDLEGPEDAGAAAEFLAFQSQKQGGHVAAASTKAESNASDATVSSSKEGKPYAPRSRRNLNPPAPSSSSFFFFQASSGQNVFLHPLDIKILLAAYGSYASFPLTLQVRVQGADEGSMNDEMRKRCQYLTHLSQGADIVFIEVDWEKMAQEAEMRQETVPVSRSVMRMYDQALRQRRNRRRERERREDRAKLRSEEQERSSRPAPMTSQQINFGLSRSPVLSAADGFGGSSFGSQAVLSPSVQQDALLHASDLSVHSDDDFPSTAQLINNGGGGMGNGEGLEGLRDSNDDSAMAIPIGTPNGRRSKASNTASTRTVWGTPAAKGSFASALHNSTRSAGSGQQGAEEDGPDWDAWLELEEDFIVGARNGNAVREGRGLNRQARRGEQATGSLTPSAQASAVASHADQQERQQEARQRYDQDVKEWAETKASASAAGAAEKRETAKSSAPTSGGGSGGKQQKKKKLVLTSGGGGRGTR